MFYGSRFLGDDSVSSEGGIYGYSIIGNDASSETHLWAFDARMTPELPASSFEHRLVVSEVEPYELRHR